MKGWGLTFTKTQHAAMKRVNSTTTDYEESINFIMVPLHHFFPVFNPVSKLKIVDMDLYEIAKIFFGR